MLGYRSPGASFRANRSIPVEGLEVGDIIEHLLAVVATELVDHFRLIGGQGLGTRVAGFDDPSSQAAAKARLRSTVCSGTASRRPSTP